MDRSPQVRKAMNGGMREEEPKVPHVLREEESKECERRFQSIREKIRREEKKQRERMGETEKGRVEEREQGNRSEETEGECCFRF